MARIFISFYNFARDPQDFNIMPPFYEAFVSGLRDAGNEILCFFHKTVNRAFEECFPEEYKYKLLGFNPELCILFNNSFWNIANLVDCPIIIYDVDSVNLFCHKSFISDNLGRYKFITIQKSGISQISEIFGVPQNKIYYIPPFSEIKHDKSIAQEKNIIFIGTNFLWKGLPELVDFSKQHPSDNDYKIAAKVINEFKTFPYVNIFDIYCKINQTSSIKFEHKNINRLAYELSGLKRLQTLTSIADLGLEIRGKYFDVEECMKYFPEVLLSINHDIGYSLKYSESVYNKFKVGINTNHLQAVSGFSWRVCDILASNACLVTEYKNDIRELFPKVGIPTFTSPYEAREQCKKLLESDSLREDIVSSAHEAIENGFRFRHVLEKIEDFTGMSLRGVAGSLEFFSDEEPKKTPSLMSKPASPTHEKYCKCKKIKVVGIPVQLHKRRINENTEFYYMSRIPMFSVRRKPNKTYYNLALLEKLKLSLRKRMPSKNEWLITVSNLRKSINKFTVRKKFQNQGNLTVCIFADRLSTWAFGKLYECFFQKFIF